LQDLALTQRDDLEQAEDVLAVLRWDAGPFIRYVDANDRLRIFRPQRDAAAGG